MSICDINHARTPGSAILTSSASTIVTTATTQRNVFNSETRSRSSSDEVGSTGSFDAGLRVERIGQGPCPNLSRRGEKSNPEIGLQLGSSTLSLEDLDGEQTFYDHGI